MKIDLTQNYIRMCKQAKEIQNSCTHYIGSLFAYESENMFSDNFYMISNIVNVFKDSEYPDEDMLYSYTDCVINSIQPLATKFIKKRENTIWIPDIQQLLNQLINKGSSFKTYNNKEFFSSFNEWLNDPYGLGSMPFKGEIKILVKWNKYIKKFKQLNELILAFVMFRLYDKIWEKVKGVWIKDNINERNCKGLDKVLKDEKNCIDKIDIIYIDNDNDNDNSTFIFFDKQSINFYGFYSVLSKFVSSDIILAMNITVYEMLIENFSRLNNLHYIIKNVLLKNLKEQKNFIGYDIEIVSSDILDFNETVDASSECASIYILDRKTKKSLKRIYGIRNE